MSAKSGAAEGAAAASTKERFEKAVNVIRSLPPDGKRIIKMTDDTLAYAESFRNAGAFKPSDMVKLKVRSRRVAVQAH